MSNSVYKSVANALERSLCHDAVFVIELQMRSYVTSSFEVRNIFYLARISPRQRQ